MKRRNSLIINNARVAELADALDLGSSGEIRRGSTPLSRTIFCRSKGYAAPCCISFLSLKAELETWNLRLETLFEKKRK